MNSEATKYYSDYYQEVTNTGLVGIVARLTHASLESKPFVRGSKFKAVKTSKKILEVGAGQGQHFKYVKKNYDSYLMTDWRPELLPKISIDPEISVSKDSIDAEKLPFQDNEFDRLVATCLLIHLQNPELALQEWRRVVRDKGIITIYVPCETGLFLRLLQKLTTRKKQKRLGFNANYLHYTEHRYSYIYLLTIIKEIFGDSFSNVYSPFLIGGYEVNLWSVVTIQNVK